MPRSGGGKVAAGLGVLGSVLQRTGPQVPGCARDTLSHVCGPVCASVHLSPLPALVFL